MHSGLVQPRCMCKLVVQGKQGLLNLLLKHLLLRLLLRVECTATLIHLSLLRGQLAPGHKVFESKLYAMHVVSFNCSFISHPNTQKAALGHRNQSQTSHREPRAALDSPKGTPQI